jgi:hypothetical protein
MHCRRRGLPIDGWLLAGALAAMPHGGAFAHQAPAGWSYGVECCSSLDCFQAPPGEIAETPLGYRVRSTGELIPYADSRIKRSRDEFFHRCSPGGDARAKRSICLYVPDRGF